MSPEARAEVPPAGAVAPVALAPGPHLFLDDTLIASSEHVARKVASPRRDLPGPIVTGPEDRNFQPYVTVVRDPRSRRFRMWYNASPGEADAGLGYLESADGVRWERPHRQLMPPPGMPFRYGASVLDEGPAVADPANRFKLAWWMKDGMVVAGSPDGFAWKLLAPGPVLAHNHDIDGIFRDPIRNRYIALVSTYITGPTWKGQRRCTQQSVSTDLVHWEKPWLVLTPDDSKEEGETQFYCMSGVVARGGLLIGTVKVLRDELPADPGGPRAGIGYTALAWSHDGKTWTRDREPFLPRAPEPGAWDHAMSWIDCQLPVGDDVFFYYAGYARGHKIERFRERQLGLVRIRRDRYVAREAGEEPGTLRTPQVTLGGKALTLNAEARAGEIRCQLLDAGGKPLPGFTYAECRAISADGLELPVRWKRGLETLKGRPVQLEVRLRQAKLYALGLTAS